MLHSKRVWESMMDTMHIRDLERRENAAANLAEARAELTRREDAVSAAQERLKRAAYEMVLDCDFSIQHVAQAAGVHRQTMTRWVEQERTLRASTGQMNADPFR